MARKGLLWMFIKTDDDDWNLIELGSKCLLDMTVGNVHHCTRTQV
jgi:hypothetical protein